ncbi:MAG: hypothetical protein HN348_16015 [Proteobacteria bacterium]|nr:hypothetical protein [Pseudomonadota bacterium]
MACSSLLHSLDLDRPILSQFGGRRCLEPWQLGDIEDGSVMAGQLWVLINDVPMVAELLQSMMAG